MSYQPSPNDVRCTQCREWYHKALTACPMCDAPRISTAVPSPQAAQSVAPLRPRMFRVTGFEKFLIWATALVVFIPTAWYVSRRYVNPEAPMAYSAMCSYVRERNIEMFGDRARCTLSLAPYSPGYVRKISKTRYTVRVPATVESPWGVPVQGEAMAILSPDPEEEGKWRIFNYEAKNAEGGYPSGVPLIGDSSTRVLWCQDWQDMDEFLVHGPEGKPGMVATDPRTGKVVWAPTPLNALISQGRAGYLPAGTTVRPVKNLNDEWLVEVEAGVLRGKTVAVSDESLRLPPRKDFTGCTP